MPWVNIKGVGRLKFPDGMTRDEIKATLDREMEKYDPTEGMNTLQKFNVGMGRGLMDVAQGAKQMYLELAEQFGAVPEGTADAYTKDVEREIGYMNRLGDAGRAGRFVGNVAATAPIPGGVAGNALTRAGTAALAGGGANALFFVPEGQSRTMNALTGAGFGGGVSMAMSGVGKAYNTLRNVPSDESYTAIQGLGRQHDVPVFFDDMSKSAGVKRAGTAIDQVPFVGTGNKRAVQGQSAKEAAERMIVRARRGKEYQDVGQEIFDSVRNKRDVVRAIKDRKYAKVSEIAGEDIVPTRKMNAAAKKWLDKELARPEQYQDKELIALMTKYSTDPAASMDELLSSVRHELGSELSEHAGTKIGTALGKVRSALDDDLDGFASATGGDLNKAWRDANDYYRTQYLPYKNKKTAISKVFGEQEPDRLYRKFIKRDRKDLAAQLYRSLDSRGRDAVRVGILEDAMDSATTTVNNAVAFSPAKFAKKLRDLEGPVNVFFKKGSGTPIDEVEGFTKLMEHIKRAGQFAENPPTGKRWESWLMGGAAVGSTLSPDIATATGIGVGGTAVLRYLFTTSSGKRLLTSASKAKPGTKPMQMLADNLYNIIPKMAAVAENSEPETAGRQ